MKRALSVLLTGGGVLLALSGVVAPSSLVGVAAASSDDAESAPGPCEDGYVAPTPESVAVSEVPIVVESTPADYFVLFVPHPNAGRTSGNQVNPEHIAVSVTRGQEGSTVLRDNLKPLAPVKYRVEKYQVAQPGDIDGDCIDDITELDGLGAYNPLNPGLKISNSVGRVAIDSQETFEAISALNAPDSARHKWGRPLVKFTITGWLTSNPAVYFMDHSKTDWQFHHYLRQELRRVGVADTDLHSSLKGTMDYWPNVIAPDGSLGVYAYDFRYSYPPPPYIAHLHQLMASALPFTDNNLAFHIARPKFEPHYKANKAKFDALRVNGLLTADILPDVDYVPLNQAEGYGLLRLMGPDDDDPRMNEIPIYESLPNDLPRVAGSITTVPQTPLSHVNLRAIQNGVPNAFLRDVLKIKEYTDLIGKHVYFSVTAEGFTLRAATKAEVDEHHENLRPAVDQTLVRDLSVTGIAALADVSFADWDAFGVKAANMAELSKLSLPAGTVPVGYAVPFYFYDEFMKANGLYGVVNTMLADEDFKSDYDEQKKQLKALRKKIKKGTTPDWIIAALEDMHDEYPAGTSLRYRSSTNNEDLPAFSGAGLYDSKTQDPDETTEDGIDKSIKAVWASLWNYRAFLERDYYRVDHKSVAMGVLVHPNFSDERVNGVAVSYDPITYAADIYYVNSQLGEDLVTNPEAKSHPEQLLLNAAGEANVLARSNLVQSGELLMSDAQMLLLRKNLETIHERFALLYNVGVGDRFAIEIEFKITAGNTLAIKQARPWLFANTISMKPTVWLSFATPTVTEGSPLKLVATRAGGTMSAPLSVGLAWTDPGQRIQGARPESVQFEAGKATAVVSVPTALTAAVEADSSVTAAVKAGSHYVVGASSSATATVEENPAPVPEVSVVGGGGVVEGGDAVFTVSASPAPSAPLLVSVTVAQTGDFGASTGAQTVSVPSSGSVSVRVGTSDDDVDEVDGSVGVSVDAGDGYTVSGSQGSATVDVSDDDDPPSAGCESADALAAEARENHDGLANTAANRKERNDWWRAWIALSGKTGTYNTPLTVAEARVLESGDSRWTPFRVALECLEGAPSVVVPEVSVVGGSGVVEGGDAVFVVSASPAPSAPLLVSVTVAQTGDFGASTGAQTVSVPPSGSVSVTVGTSDDDVDEVDGSVGVSVDAGDGYTVSGSQGAATVDVSDDDDPPSAGCESADALAAEARENHDGLANTAANRKERNDWWRAWIALSGKTGTYNTPLTVAEARVLESGDSRWTPFRVALECLEGAPSVVVPEVSVVGGSGVVEGGDAVFVVSASPAPSAPLLVSVTVAQTGDFGASTGAQTVSVPTSGSVSVAVGTSDDDVDEVDGSVGVSVDAGDGYTVSGSQGSATVDVSDDDDPSVVAPVVSVVGGSGVTEGGDAVFTVSASPAPASPLTVNVTVSQSGDFGVSTGSRVVTVPTSGSVSVTVGTSDDDADEADGSVSVSVDSGDGYTVSGSQGSATVNVSDDDDPPPVVVPEVSVTGGSDVTEGGDAVFTVSASPAPSAPLLVSVSVVETGDFGVSTGSRSVTVPTGGSVSVSVGTSDDDADEADGSVSVSVDSGDGYTVSGSQGSATVNVSDDDDPPPVVVPEVSVTGGLGVTEGGDAVFTVSVLPVPSVPLSVSVVVAQSGDFGVVTGSRTVVVGTGGSATVTVATGDDSIDESDGSVSVTVSAGDGYTVSSAQGSASVAVSDDDPPVVDLPEVSVADGSVVEGQLGLLSLLEFRVTLSEASKQDVTVSYVIRSGTALGGLDYWGGRGQVTIWAGSTSATIGVNVRDDNRRERDETLSVELTEADGAVITAGSAVGTIIDND